MQQVSFVLKYKHVQRNTLVPVAPFCPTTNFFLFSSSDSALTSKIGVTVTSRWSCAEGARRETERRRLGFMPLGFEREETNRFGSAFNLGAIGTNSTTGPSRARAKSEEVIGATRARRMCARRSGCVSSMSISVSVEGEGARGRGGRDNGYTGHMLC